MGQKLLHSVQTVPVTHPASYSMGTGGSFTGWGVKLTTELPSNAGVKNGGAIPPLLMRLRGVLYLKSDLLVFLQNIPSLRMKAIWIVKYAYILFGNFETYCTGMAVLVGI
jgi:hypothetical protein